MHAALTRQARQRLLVLGASIVAACADVPAERRTWPAASAEIAYLLAIPTPSGPATAQLGGFELIDGMPADGAVRELTVEEGGEVLLLGFNRGAFRQLNVELAAHAASGARLEHVAESDCPAGRRTIAGGHLRVRLSVRALAPTVFATSKGAGAFSPVEAAHYPVLEGMSLEVDALAEPCPASAGAALVPFDPEHQPSLPNNTPILGRQEPQHFPNSDPYYHPTATLRLDDDRVLLASPRVLYLLTRGRAFSDQPVERIDLWAQGLPAAQASTRGWAFQGLALDPSRSSTTVKQIVAVARATEDPAGAQHPRGAVLDIAVGPEGLRSARTTTLTERMIPGVLVEDDGAVFLPGHGVLVNGAIESFGVLYTAPSVDGPYREIILDTALTTRWIHRSADGRHPHVVGLERGVILYGDARASDPEWTREISTEFGSVEGYADRLTSAGLEAWASTGRKEFLHRDPASGEWSQIPLFLPPALRLCSGRPDACGQTQPSSPIVLDDLVIGPARTHIALALDDCDTMVTVSLDRTCASSLLPQGHSEATNNTRVLSTSIEPSGRITAATPHGEIWEYVLP